MQTGFVERDGYRLHYAMSGRNHAPPLLLLHPLGAALEVWAPVLPMLEPHFRVVRYDVRGHGKSELDAGPPSPRAMDDMAADALAFLAGDLARGGVLARYDGWAQSFRATRFERLTFVGSPD